MKNPAECFFRDGFAILERVVPVGVCDALAHELTLRLQAQQDGARSRIGGVRNLLQFSPLVADVASSNPVTTILNSVMGASVFPVRSIFFDKTPDANWSVAWHQDLHIAVAEKIETPGFGPWTVKAGVPHVQPTLEVLNDLVTLRLHLDDCRESNGALKVIAGSHSGGVLDNSAFEKWKQHAPVVCEVPKGGAMLMRPLLLHASSPAVNPGHRRVLHIEYATKNLPNGLRWFESK